MRVLCGLGHRERTSKSDPQRAASSSAGRSHPGGVVRSKTTSGLYDRMRGFRSEQKMGFSFGLKRDLNSDSPTTEKQRHRLSSTSKPAPIFSQYLKGSEVAALPGGTSDTQRPTSNAEGRIASRRSELTNPHLAHCHFLTVNWFPVSLPESDPFCSLSPSLSPSLRSHNPLSHFDVGRSMFDVGCSIPSVPPKRRANSEIRNSHSCPFHS